MIGNRLFSVQLRAAFSLLIVSVLLSGCISSGGRTVGTVADTGVLTRKEMESAAAQMAPRIAATFKTRGDGKIEDVFVALLPTKNDTSEMIDTEIFDYALVERLKGEGVFTVRPEDRNAAVEEMKLNLSGLGDESLSLGNMKSPNYFVKTVISESFYRRKDNRIIEHTIRTELRSVETQVVVWSDARTYTKKLARRKNDVAW